MTSISLWGDSIGKGVVFDEARGRYVILKENCVALLGKMLGAPIDNHAAMGCTARKAAQRMTDVQLTPGGVADYIREKGLYLCAYTEKKLVEAYRRADSQAKKDAMKVLKGEGAEALLDYLLSTDFFEAPASAHYQSSCAGGLSQH